MVACTSADGRAVEIRFDPPNGEVVIVADGVASAATPVDAAGAPALFVDPATGVSLVQVQSDLAVVASGADPVGAPRLTTPDGLFIGGGVTSPVVTGDTLYLTWLVGDRLAGLRVAGGATSETVSLPLIGFGWPAGAVFSEPLPAMAPGTTPSPLFERTGTVGEASPISVGPPASGTVTSLPADAAPGEGRAWWPWIAVVLLAAAGLAVGTLPNRRRGRSADR